MSLINVTIPTNSTASNSSNDSSLAIAFKAVLTLSIVMILALYLILGWAFERDGPRLQRLPRWVVLPMSVMLAPAWWVLDIPWYRLYINYIWWPASQVWIDMGFAWDAFVALILEPSCILIAGGWREQ